MTTTTRLLPDELIDRFQRDGFVVVPDLLTEQEMDHFAPLLSAAIAERAAGDTRAYEEKSRYEQLFRQCMNLWEDNEALRPLTFHQKVARAAAELIGVDGLRLWHDQALSKPAGGRPTDAHQDHPYWPMKETNSITAWIAMAGSTLSTGALGYLPGTHKIGLRKFVNIFFGEPEDLLEDPEVADIEPVFVEVPRGGVAFHHGLTVHLSKPNSSGQDREVHTIIYFEDGNTRGYPVPHFAVDRAGIEVGEKIDSDVTPVIWPLANGELPRTPSHPMVLPGRFKGAGPKGTKITDG